MPLRLRVAACASAKVSAARGQQSEVTDVVFLTTDWSGKPELQNLGVIFFTSQIDGKPSGHFAAGYDDLNTGFD